MRCGTEDEEILLEVNVGDEGCDICEICHDDMT